MLQSGPLGSQPFFLGPLYPYVLAGLRWALADSIPAVLQVQAVWGSVAVVLLADAARRLTRPVVGIAIGLVLCFYAMAVHFDGLILMESLLFLIESFLLWWVVRAGDRSIAGASACGLGLVIGVLATGRASQALLVVPALALLATRRERLSGIARPALLMIVGLVAAIAPVTIRNAVVAGEWIPLTYSGGYNLYVGNNPIANGGFVPAGGVSGDFADDGRDGGVGLDGRRELRARTGREFGALESSRHWSNQAWDFIREHPRRTLRLAARRLGMLWSRHEYPQIENVEVYRRVAGPLGLPWIGTFAGIGALGVAGAGYALRADRGARFALGYCLAITLGILPFFVTDRFRHHLVPGAALLAAVFLERAIRALAEPARGALGRCALALSIGLVVVHLPLPHLSRERIEWGVARDVGQVWLERGRPDVALPHFEDAVAGEAREARSGKTTAATRGERAWLHYAYGLALLQLDRPVAAIPWLERAARELPDQRQILQSLAIARERTGSRTPAGSSGR